VPSFRYLRVKPPEKPPIEAGGLTLDALAEDAQRAIALRQINRLPENVKRRIYRGLVPSSLLAQFGIDPISWKTAGGDQLVQLGAEADSSGVRIALKRRADAADDFFLLDLSDNQYNGIDLNLLLLSDPDGLYYRTDYTEDDQPTLFGRARRNLAEEERAMQAGLAPAQTHAGLGASRTTLDNLETFLSALGQRAYSLEPLTYVSAWIFERRGFAYARGHKLMDDIQREFQPGGRLHQALDGSTPFRRPDQWRTVRGRAWAIHDGILSAMDAQWDQLRMVKQLGRSAGVNTFPDAVY
jgi:hypothetical protein